MTRPGVDYVAPVAQVGLVPGAGRPVERGWLATFHDEGGPVRGVRRHDHAARVGRRHGCGRSTWTWTSSRTRPAGCGSTTRTSSPSTGSSSATPTRSWGSRPPLATGSANWSRGVRRRSTAVPGAGSPSSSVSPPDPRSPSRARWRRVRPRRPSTRSGPTSRGPASRRSSRRRLALERLGDVLAEDHAGGQRHRDRGGGDQREQALRGVEPAALGEQGQAAVDREAGQHRHDRGDDHDQRRHPQPAGDGVADQADEERGERRPARCGRSPRLVDRLRDRHRDGGDQRDRAPGSAWARTTRTRTPPRRSRPRAPPRRRSWMPVRPTGSSGRCRRR